MRSVGAWQAELHEIADQLEAGARQWALAKTDRKEFDAIGDQAGILRSDAPWESLPHAEAVIELAQRLGQSPASRTRPQRCCVNLTKSCSPTSQQ